MKKLAFLLALLALTSARAATPTPTAEWSGSDLADGKVKGGMTLHLNGNTVADGAITIGSSSAYITTGMTSSSPNAGLEATVVLTVENVNTSLYSGLFTMTDTYQSDAVGVESYCSYGDASYLYWVKDGGYLSESSQFMTYPTDRKSHKVALGYAGPTSGTGSGGYVGCAVAFDGSYISGNASVIDAGYCITQINVGGYQDNQLPLTGAKITCIAVYTSALSTTDLAAATGGEEPEEDSVWGNIGNATDGGIATDINYGSYNNLTFNFGVTDNICTTGIGSNGVVKITKVTLLASSSSPSVPSQITLTQGEASVTSTDKDTSGTITVYGTGGTVVATRTAYVYTFSSDTLFDTSKDIVLSSSANMRISVVQPANTLFKSGAWSPAIEIAGEYTATPSEELSPMYQNRLSTGAEVIPAGEYGAITVPENGFKATALTGKMTLPTSGDDVSGDFSGIFCNGVNIQSHTVAGWFKVDALPTSGNNKLLWSVRNNQTTYGGYTVVVNSSGKVILGRTLSNADADTPPLGNSVMTPSAVITAGEWCHLAIAFKNNASGGGTGTGSAERNATVTLFKNGGDAVTMGTLNPIGCNGGTTTQKFYLGASGISAAGFYVDTAALTTAAAVVEAATTIPAPAEYEETLDPMYKNRLSAGDAVVPAGTYGAITVPKGGFKATALDAATKLSNTASGEEITGSYADIITHRDDYNHTDVRVHTLAGWFKLEALPAASGEANAKTLYVAKSIDATHGGYKVAVDGDGKIYVGKCDNEEWRGSKIVTSAAQVAAGEWFHLAVSVSGCDSATVYTSTAKIFVNGEQVETTGSTFATNLNGTNCAYVRLGTKDVTTGLGLSAAGIYVDTAALETSAAVVEAAETVPARTYVWEVDTTVGAYAFANDEIDELKTTAWKVILKSGSSQGATVGFGTQSASQKSHFVIESGTHNLTWLGNSENINFNKTGTPDDPSILVKSGATLNFTAKDITGWQGAAQNKMGNLIRVNEGGTLNLLQSGSNTHYYQGRYWLDPGATLNADSYSSNKFRLNGGAVEGSEQLYVPSATNGAPTATISAANGLRLAADTTPGLGVFVGENASLDINANVSSDGARPLTKWGAGTLALNSALTAYKGTLTVNAGTLKIAQPTLGGALTMKTGTTLDVAFAGVPTTGTAVLTATAVTVEDGATVLVNGTAYPVEVTDTAIVVKDGVARVGATIYGTILEAARAAGDGGVMTLLKDYAVLEEQIDAAAVTLTPGEGENVYTNNYKWASGAALRMAEIMPKPTDALVPGTLCGMDPNGLESGWVELENVTNAWVDLADYKFIRVNRSKANSKGDYGNFPSANIGPNERYVFWTSERYANSADMSVSAFATPVDAEKPHFFEQYNMMVWPDKVNPKKFAFVRLYYAPGGTESAIVDTVVIPSDLPEGCSIIVTPVADDAATVRYLCEAPTRGEENPDVAGLEKFGPNAGPLYEIKDGKKHNSASEFVRAVPMASTDAAYRIRFAMNPTMSPTESAKFRAKDKIDAIKLVYRFNLGSAFKTNDVDLATRTSDAKDWGDEYTAEIPAEDLAALGPGELVQWKFLVTDKAGNVWTTPSFHNKDDGYEWYGTITEPSAAQMSAKLPTWHMFAEEGVADKSAYNGGNKYNDQTSLMNIDADDAKFVTEKFPYGARVGIYDSSTSNYYDFVRIDLRGNTSKDFLKKSHGLRFAKTHPMTMVDSVTGETVEEIRKTSLISEFADPSRLRQLLAFWFFNQMKSDAPFDFPVRVNLNGKFYQLGYNSERFTDELLEDVYGWDKFGYGYKEAGPWSGNRTKTEKKTPDDGNEADLTVLNDFCHTYLAAASQVAASVDGSSSTGLENAALTKNVVRWFDLPRWLNYLAASKISQECDDVWANLGAYYDGPAMKEGCRGTHTWRPAAYDMNLSFGQWYWQDIGGSRNGLKADQDWYKSHPFYGGFRVRCYAGTGMGTTKGEANYAVEAIWQHEKFRRLFLRRLRTIMDEQLGEPNADETLATATTPLLVKMRELVDLMQEDADLDRQTWGPLDTTAAGATEINVWGAEANQPANMAEGVAEIWDDYIVPRRVHLFETHAIDNVAKGVGYASNLSAGIPAAQSPIEDLKGQFSVSYDDALKAVTIHNGNDEAVDLSGWKLEGAMTMTLPNGTVVDANDSVYVVLDRYAYVEAKLATLTDEVIVGNAKAVDPTTYPVLKAADGTRVAPNVPDEDYAYEPTAGATSTGWMTSYGEAFSLGGHFRVGPAGECVSAIDSSGHPYASMSGGKSNYSFALYADLSKVETGSYVGYVMVAVGTKGGISHGLMMSSDGTVNLVRASNGTVSAPVAKTTAPVPAGYHLFVWTQSTTAGGTLYVDGVKVGVDTSITSQTANGFQLGSVHGGVWNSNYARAYGMAVGGVYGWDKVLSDGEVAMFAESHPATAGGVAATEVDSRITGTLTLVDGDGIPSGSHGCAIVVDAGAHVNIVHEGEVKNGMLVLSATALTVPSDAAVTVNGKSYQYVIDATGITVFTPVAEVGGVEYATIVAAARAAGDGGVMTLLKPYDALAAEIDAAAVTLTPGEGENVYTNNYKWASGVTLRVSEVMPKPSDKPHEITTQSGYDKNGLESGWVELYNTTNAWVDLKDYKFMRANRGKKANQADYGNFPSAMIGPNEYFSFYTSERYSNSASQPDSAWEHGTFDGKPIWYGDMLIWGDKVNPKKFPMVTFAYLPAGEKKEKVVDTVVIPSDTPEGYSIIVGEKDATTCTKRWLCDTPTFNAANGDTTDLPKLGPNVGPLYGVKHSVGEFNPAPPAVFGEDYEIALNVNPVYNGNDNDAITGVVLEYRTKLDDDTLASVTMTKDAGETAGAGATYRAKIPHAAFDSIGNGQIIQWRTKITDAAGNEWTSPSFNNPDDGYEWYGTITEPGSLNSAKLATWHMFLDSDSLKQMDVDADKQTLPYNARAAIYDASTSNYYDYVRIDLRGNTSKSFTKKSHGLRFAKAHPLTMHDFVSGEDIEEIRKTSLIGEPADPSYMRQLIAFWLLNKVDSPAPFDFPVRVNRNGEFYQMAFNSERFTDELIEDVYGLDKYGFSYKNVGTLKSGGGTTAGGIEKKTPDDGNESDISVLQNELRAKITAAQQVGGTTAAQLNGTDATGLDNAALTKFVVQKFDLPAWLNYLAITKITQEMDDVWANISMYYDNAEMKEGARGTGTWMPLAYDMNVCFGQHYIEGGVGRTGPIGNLDRFKGHPFYGGNRVRCYGNDACTSTVNNGNDGFEAVWQNAKFRRLYLRRLRTLMDQELKAPGTPETEIPLMVKMRELEAIMRDDAATDRAKYPDDGSFNAIDVWGSSNFPATMALGIDDLWTNYIQPRQTHLFVTHSVTNDSWTVGYGVKCNAGIPEPQSPVADLKAGFAAEFDEDNGVVAIHNANDEVIDLSDWTLEGPLSMTLPAGTVVDANDSVFVVADRRAYVAAIDADITNQVIVGNGTLGKDPAAAIILKAADGTPVIAPTEKSEQEKYLRLWGFCGAPDGESTDKNEFLIFTNLNQTAALDVSDAEFQTEKSGAVAEDRCHFFIAAGTTIPAGGWLRVNQADVPWTKITDGKVDIWLKDSAGKLIYQLYADQGAIDVKGNGYFAVYDNEAGTWSRMLITDAPGYVPPKPPAEQIVITGAYPNGTNVVLTGETVLVVSNATFGAALNLAGAFDTVVNLPEGAVSTMPKITAEGKLTFTGEGKLAIIGEKELVAATGDLVVDGGELELNATIAKDKDSVVLMTGNFVQTGGKVTLNMTGGKKGYGLRWSDQKGFTATISGGEFVANVASGEGSAAFKANKGSNDFILSGGKLAGSIAAVDGRIVDVAGNVKINGDAVVDVTGDGTAAHARVFKTEKKVTIGGTATVDVKAPGAESEAFSADNQITIEGGVVRVDSADDCFSAQTNIVVSGGIVYGHSVSNDVFDSNGQMTISGGTVIAYTLAEGHEAFDTEPATADEQSHAFTISGGTIVGLGGKNAAWPTTCVFEQDTFTKTDLDPAACSGQYLVVDGEVEKFYAKLPEIGDSFIVLATVKGLAGDPTVSATCPVETPIAEGVPAWRKLKHNQQSLRFAEIYGNTAEGSEEAGTLGDVGEYFVLTNMSANAVYLNGLEIEITKTGTATKKSKCHFTVSGDMAVAPGSACRFDQSVWGWEKITNGDLTLKLTDADGKTVQGGETSNDYYPECDGNGASLVAKTFGTTLAMTQDDWEPSFRWYYFTAEGATSTITGFGTAKLAEATLTLPTELGKVPVTTVAEGAFSGCAFTTLKVVLAEGESLRVLKTESKTIAKYDMSESKGELVLGYALGSTLNVAGATVVGPAAATLTFDIGNATQTVNGTTDDATKQYGITVKSGTLDFTSTGENTAFRDRVVAADGSNAVIRLGVGDATGYRNPAKQIALRNGARMDVTLRDTSLSPIVLEDGEVKLVAGCATGNRGFDLYNGSGNSWTVSGDSKFSLDPNIGSGDGRKLLIRKGDWNVDVAADSVFTVEPSIVASSGSTTVGKLVKLGEGTLYLTATDNTYTTATEVKAGTLKLAQDEITSPLTMALGTTLELVRAEDPEYGTVVLAAPSITFASDVRLCVNGNECAFVNDGTTLMVAQPIAVVNGRVFANLSDALAVAGRGGRLTLLVDKSEVEAELEANAVDLEETEEPGVYTVKYRMAAGTSLIISEIMPKPTDAQNRGTLCGMDPNGLESGWVELVNTTNAWVDLADYKFIRVNRSKANDKGDYGNFPSVLVKPNSRYVFWTSERYANSADMSVSAFATPVDAEKPHYFGEYDMVVWPDKVNPKKFAFVRLYYAPGGTEGSIVDTVVIPTDLPEGCSIIVNPVAENEATVRYICEAPTRGEANPDVAGLEPLGPNVGPLYEISSKKKHDSASEFGAVPMANANADYEISFALNPTMHPTEAQTDAGNFRAADAIASIRVVYRTNLDDATLATNDVSLTAGHKWDKKDQGHTYKAVIPKAAFAGIGEGRLIQWKFLITDAAGNEWVSPSYHNPDDGYEWYGTITEPGSLASATLPTWHMFADAESVQQMDVDADDQTLPNNARVAIYDATTSNYYDYVRIDLRGNTSAGFAKKSHGLRFAKAHPLMMTDIVTGEPLVKEVRKSSLIGEPADPSYMRQMMAFWLLNKVGSPAPFDFPVRCNLNGKFFQMAFHSERFTDELIEDVYGLDKFGYSYKNVGTLKSGSSTTAGGIEKKTPDDENEGDISVLQNELRAKITAAQNVGGTTAAQLDGTDATGLDNPALTKFVVEKFDLPAWLNYLAITKITSECDDVWANISIYYDNPTLLEGHRGTGTWMPLAYDMNLSFGQWYYGDLGGTRSGLKSNDDWYKSHPFYGGNRVRCWKGSGYGTICGNGNDGIEAVWQNAKFRRLYLRRLRTLMDQELKAPGTPEEEVPFMVKIREMAELMQADAATDRAKYPPPGGFSAINVWGDNWPTSMDAGIADIWNNYVVPRREHLYVTHAVTNESWAVGYGSKCNAGIPEAQSAIPSLKPCFGYELVEGGIKITNSGDEVIDLSGWTLGGPVAMTVPNGTVLDAKQGEKNGEVYFVLDRRAYVEANADALTDEVIVGNAKAGTVETVSLVATDEAQTDVFGIDKKSDQELYLRLWGFCGAPDGESTDKNEFIVFTNLNQTAALDVSGAEFQTEKNGAAAEDRCHFSIAAGTTIPAGGWLRVNQADVPWTKITDGKVDIWLKDSAGKLIYQLYADQGAIDVKGNGYFAVYDNEAGTWSRMLISDAPGGTVPVQPGEAPEMKAQTEEEAQKEIAKYEVKLTDEDKAAGVEPETLKMVAVPVTNELGAVTYYATVAVNPFVVEEPAVGEDSAGTIKPIEITPDGEGNTTVSVGINNAAKGLWYGYEVSEALGTQAFENDVPSFKRATGEAIKVQGSKRSGNAAFFRVKVLPAKPTE